MTKLDHKMWYGPTQNPEAAFCIRMYVVSNGFPADDEADQAGAAADTQIGGRVE